MYVCGCKCGSRCLSCLVGQGKLLPGAGLLALGLLAHRCAFARYPERILGEGCWPTAVHLQGTQRGSWGRGAGPLLYICKVPREDPGAGVLAQRCAFGRYPHVLERSHGIELVVHGLALDDGLEVVLGRGQHSTAGSVLPGSAMYRCRRTGGYVEVDWPQADTWSHAAAFQLEIQLHIRVNAQRRQQIRAAALQHAVPCWCTGGWAIRTGQRRGAQGSER